QAFGGQKPFFRHRVRHNKHSPSDMQRTVWLPVQANTKKKAVPTIRMAAAQQSGSHSKRTFF
ncbi:MAG: hypothetical protein KAZ24_00500, partial [Brachymonas sp.]|nr:hypothetical protein [Brachymonas sp.]